MKTNPSYQKPLQKPIKYKQFIQQLQNSSRSSNIDQSLLSQRSFRQSTTARDHNEKFKHQTCQYLCQKQSPQKLNFDQSSYKIPHRLHVDRDKPTSQIQDKLYTFCDAKITQKSIEITNNNTSISITNSTEQHQNKPIIHNNTHSNKKYFKTNKERNQQKENIDFVNQILSKVESGQFQKKLTKVQNCCQLKQNLQQKDQTKSPQRIQLIKTQKSQKDLLSSQPNNSQRKIQSVKKIFVLSRQSSNRNSSKKKLAHNNLSEQNSKQWSVHKNEQKKQHHQQQQQNQHQQQQQSNQKCSSKKKIISLNINPLKTNLNNQLFNNNHNINNPTKVKLSLNKSCDKNIQKSINAQNSSLSHSLSKMPSLNQSKILYQQNTCINYNQLNDNSSHHQQQQIQKLTKLLNQYKEKQKKSSKQIYQLNKKLKHAPNESQKKQLQILQKDCMRLTNSYKQIKKLYQTITKSKQQLQNHLQNVLKQNNDLKQCLNFKSHEVISLTNQLSSMHTKIQQLQHSLQQTHTFPQQLSGLSQIIKQKLTQYQSQICSLLNENNKLVLLREKLQNYNRTLKEQIQQKDNIIQSLQGQLQEITTLQQLSQQEQISNYVIQNNDLRLNNKLCKELESKLKLANIHNDYLTKEIISLKQEKKQLISSMNHNNNHSATSSIHVGNVTQSRSKTKLTSSNTLANTITTRNSSICYASNNFQHFLQNLNKQKVHGKEVIQCCSEDKILD